MKFSDCYRHEFLCFDFCVFDYFSKTNISAFLVSDIYLFISFIPFIYLFFFKSKLLR